MKVGIIGVQGDVSEHQETVINAGKEIGLEVETEKIRKSGKVPESDILIIPGGESTTISNLIYKEGISEEIVHHYKQNKPILATCAGLIVLSSNSKDERIKELELLDISVERNAFGRQKESFETEIQIDGLEDSFPAIFIRAPIIDSTGENVKILSKLDNEIVIVRQRNTIGTSFHPELSNDYRIHKLLFEKCLK